jgi:tetratricopeptide (TPR) repeat protein
VIVGTEPESPLMTAETQRRVAVELFNLTWQLLDAVVRTPDQDDRMLHAAHASRFHWGEVGEPVNLARGEWQCSRVYAVLGRAEPAIHHARRCLEICEANGIADFDLALAWEALARAQVVAGDQPEAVRSLARARELTGAIAEDEDREVVLADLADLDARLTSS